MSAYNLAFATRRTYQLCVFFTSTELGALGVHNFNGHTFPRALDLSFEDLAKRPLADGDLFSDVPLDFERVVIGDLF